MNRKSHNVALAVTLCGWLLTASSLCAQESFGQRTWVDATGTYKIPAELIDFSAAAVKLKKPDGSVIDVLLDKLSPEDNQYVEQLLKQRAARKAAAIEAMNQPTVNENASNVPPTRPAKMERPNASAPLKITPSFPNTSENFRPESKRNLAKPNFSSVKGFWLDSTHHSRRDLPPNPINVGTGMFDAQSSLPSNLVVGQPNPQFDEVVHRRRELKALKENWTSSSAKEIPRLVKLTQSPDKFVRQLAVEILCERDPDNSFDAIASCIDDKSFEVRWIVFEHLDAQDDPRAIDPLIQRFTGEDRNKIGTVLVGYGSQIEDKLMPFLSNSSRDVRMATCSLLAKIGTEKCLTALQELSEKDSDLRVRMQAAGAVKKLGKRLNGQ